MNTNKFWYIYASTGQHAFLIDWIIREGTPILRGAFFNEDGNLIELNCVKFNSNLTKFERLEEFKKRLIEVQKEPFKITDLKMGGNDVMKILNIKPGPKVGEILKSIFNDVEEGRVKNQKEMLLKKIEEFRSKYSS